MVGQSSIAAGPQVGPDLGLDHLQAVPVDRGMLPVPRMDPAVRAGPCTPHGLNQVGLRDPVDDPALVPPGQVSAPGQDLALPGLASAVRAA